MFFEIDAASWTRAVAQVRGVALRRTWWRIGYVDGFWNPAFLAAFVERVDAELLDSPPLAYEMSKDLPLLATRLRAEDCPHGEIGRRSLLVWAWSVRGSACRVVEAVDEAERAFVEAHALAFEVLPWALAEACRRFAALLIQQKNAAAFDFIDRASALYSGYWNDVANTHLLRGVAYRHLKSDSASAILNYSRALDLLDSVTTPFELRIWHAAINNIAFEIAVSEHSTRSEIADALGLLQQCRTRLTQRSRYRRRLMTWIEGLLYVRLGAIPKAERRLLATWRWLLKHDYLHLAVVVAFDIAALARSCHDEGRVQEIIATTNTALEKRGSSALHEYVLRWCTAEITEQAVIRTEVISAVGLPAASISHSL